MRRLALHVSILSLGILAACSDTGPRTLKETRIELVENAFYVYAFETTREQHVRYEVDLVIGSEIDAFLVDQHNYRLWEDRQTFEHMLYGGFPGIDGHWESQWITLPPNQRFYVIIQDSRGEGRSTTAQVDFLIQAAG